MITREFNLYLHAGHSIPLVINVNQYDRGETWVFTLFNADGTQYTPSSGAIVGIKSDNLGIINSGTVDSQGRVVINETQQMTAAVGKAVFELLIDDQTHGTANFIVLVEPKPGDNADLSESDISMIEEAVEAAANIKPYGSPLVASTVAGMTDETKVYVYTGSETGYTSGHWYYYDGDSWEDGGVYNSVAVQTDTTLAISGMAADSKKVGDEISDLKSQILNGGVKDSIKQALLGLADAVGYKNDETGASARSALYHALYDVEILSLNASFDRGEGMIFTCDDIESLRDSLTVIANYDNGTSGEVTTYTLSGTLTAGTSTITVEYLDKTTTFTVADVIEGTDVTPALTAFTQGTYSKLEVNTANKTIRVYNTTNRTYQGVSAPFTMESGYTYKLDFDVAITSGLGRATYTDSNNSSIGAAYTTGSISEDGHNTLTAAYDSNVAKFFLYCTWGTATQGNVTYSNIRIVKYIAEGGE